MILKMTEQSKSILPKPCFHSLIIIISDSDARAYFCTQKRDPRFMYFDHL